MVTSPESLEFGSAGSAGSAGAAGADVRVLLIERAGCHLCQAAHQVLDSVALATGERWVSVDVDASAGLQEAYGELVPAVVVDGAVVGYWRFGAAEVRAALG